MAHLQRLAAVGRLGDILYLVEEGGEVHDNTVSDDALCVGVYLVYRYIPLHTDTYRYCVLGVPGGAVSS